MMRIVRLKLRFDPWYARNASDVRR